MIQINNFDLKRSLSVFWGGAPAPQLRKIPEISAVKDKYFIIYDFYEVNISEFCNCLFSM